MPQVGVLCLKYKREKMIRNYNFAIMQNMMNWMLKDGFFETELMVLVYEIKLLY